MEDGESAAIPGVVRSWGLWAVVAKRAALTSQEKEATPWPSLGYPDLLDKEDSLYAGRRERRPAARK